MTKSHSRGKAPSRHAKKMRNREARKHEGGPSHENATQKTDRKAQGTAPVSRSELLRQNRRWLQFKRATSSNRFLTEVTYQQLSQLWAKPRSQPTPGTKPVALDENAKRGVEMLEQEREAARAQQGHPETVIDWFAVPGSGREQQNRSLLLMGEGWNDDRVLIGKSKAFVEGLMPVQGPELGEADSCRSWEYRNSIEEMMTADDDRDSE